MAQEKSIESQIPHLTSEQSQETPQATPEDIIKPLEDEEQDFDFWEDLKDSLPPWLDEVVGFALVIFGILSFISLFIPSEAAVAVAWADMLTTLFGDGSAVVAGTLFAFGIILWLPKAGLRIKFSSVRMLAVEIAFLSTLAVLHLNHSDVELRAMARAGQGGGLIGWGLSFPFYWLLGRSLALVIFGIIIGVCIVVIVGVQRRHLIAFLTECSRQLQNHSSREAQSSDESQKDDALKLYKQLVASPNYRTRIMRIRPSPQAAENQPREGLQPEIGTPTDGSPAAEQPANNFSQTLPDMNLLTAIELLMPAESETKHNVELIEKTLLEFDLDIRVADVQVGPTITRYAVQPHNDDGSERIRLSKIASYTRDLSLALSAKRLRLEMPIPGTNYMGIEVPNKQPGLVALRNVMESQAYLDDRAKKRRALYVPLGLDVSGQPISIDLAAMPHLLIAGTTGAGKSVCTAAIATALLMQNTPDRLKMVMLDPKMVELKRFNGIPHLLGVVETDYERIMGALRWCTREMEQRYKLLEKHSARNIDIYNRQQRAARKDSEVLPYIVILVDEIGDLMLHNPEETERSIARLAQMARAVGMHMAVATQRPSTDVITGVIKANFPSRIAFSVASGIDSRVILDKIGAENLLGKGDMLYLSPDAAEPRRIQGCYVSDEDVSNVVRHWRDGPMKAGLADVDLGGPWGPELARHQFLAETDDKLEEVIQLVVDAQEASASMIQRRLGLGYPRAARIMDILEELGVVGEAAGGGRVRKVIIPKGQQDPFKLVLDRYLNSEANA